jgi:hypothetical protein
MRKSNATHIRRAYQGFNVYRKGPKEIQCRRGTHKTYKTYQSYKKT